MNNFLITGFNFDGYHGSMMHICELAEYLTRNNFKVYIATCEINNSIKKEIETNSKVKIYFFNNLPLNQEYKYVLAYHEPILSFLIKKGLKFKHLGIGCLSYSIKGLEMPSLLATMNFPTFVCSKEIARALQKDFNIHKTIVFPNFIPQNFLNLSIKKPEKLKKIAIISNHVPEELLLTKSLLENDGFLVNIYGKNYNYQKITPKLLLQYDLIITIGKTVQYGFALKKPVFNYDKFGGCGYINKTNFTEAEYYNFSGRNHTTKRTPLELKSEIINGYDNALQDIDEIYNISIKKYSVNNLIPKLLYELDKSNNKPNNTPEWKIYQERCYQYGLDIISHKDFQKICFPYILSNYKIYKLINKITFGLVFKNKAKNAKFVIDILNKTFKT